MPLVDPKLILASSSKSRASVLANAGVNFAQVPPEVDEDTVKAAVRKVDGTAAQCAQKLAEMKALNVSTQHMDDFVIGCDQMLDCRGQWFDKPTDLATARAQLMALSGKRHTLFNSMVIARGGKPIWHFADQADLEMRELSNAFLDDYLTKVGDHALWSVGGYQLEGMGAQLFCSITGDFFSILGLPLLPLLGFLREHRVVKS